MVRKEQPRVILDVHLVPCNPSARRPVARPRQAALARSGTARQQTSLYGDDAQAQRRAK